MRRDREVKGGRTEVLTHCTRPRGSEPEDHPPLRANFNFPVRHPDARTSSRRTRVLVIGRLQQRRPAS